MTLRAAVVGGAGLALGICGCWLPALEPAPLAIGARGWICCLRDGRRSVYIQGHSSPGIYARAFLAATYVEIKARRCTTEVLYPGHALLFFGITDRPISAMPARL
jgi:hypothetical protein